MNKICFGCGVKLQSDDKNKVGYVPEAKMDSAKYCMRCFRMMHYGENNHLETPKDIKEIINKVNKDQRFVIFLVDFLNLNKEVIKIFDSITKRKVLIVNKCELIPKHIVKERIIDYIRNYYGITSDIKLKGGNSFHGAKVILNYLRNNGIREAYILGISNSGKSTLINDLVDITGVKTNRITVNSRANTTLDFIRVNIADDIMLIDSPGFILPDSLENDVSGKKITAYSMQIKMGETLSLLDGKYFVKFDNDTAVTFYTNASCAKNVKKYYRAAPDLNYIVKLDHDNMDLVLYGIGFLSVKKRCNITTNIPSKNIEVRKSMFGGTNE